MLYYGISGGRDFNHRHLVSLTFAVRRIRPCHVILMMESNDLDFADPYFDVECLVFRLIAFLTQLRNTNQLVSITVLSLFHQEITRFVHTDIFNQRLLAANNLLQEQCRFHNIQFLKLRGFTNSQMPILCDGVHLNNLGHYKRVRQIRGILLLQHS